MTEAIINSDESLSRCIGALREDYKRNKWLRINWRVGKDRSLNQNAIAHVWYEQVARELREDDALGVKRWCKLHFGVPILRAEDTDFREFYDAAIKPHLDYPQKLQAMDHLPVTSQMTKPQMSKYLQAMQDHYRTMSVFLEFPGESVPS